MKFLVAVVLVVVAAVGGVFVYLDMIAKAGIERGATYATGVRTGVRSVSLGLASGQFGVSGLRVDNPNGFSSPYFFALDSARLELPLRDLLEDTVTVPRIELSGIDVYIEKGKGGANYQAILDNLAKLGSGGKEPAEPAGGGKTFIVRELLIRDVRAHLNLASLPSEKGKLDVVIPEIRLTDIDSKNGAGVAVSQLTSIVTNAVLRAVMKNGIGIPQELLGDLGGELAALGSLRFESSGALSERGGKVLGELATGLKDGGIEEKAKEVGDRLKGDFLKGLLGNKDAEQPTAPDQP